MDFNSKDFPSRKSKSLQWLPVVCSFIVGTGVLCAIVAVLILASKAKLKLPGHWAVQLTASGESVSTTHFLQKLWPDFTEGRDRGGEAEALAVTCLFSSQTHIHCGTFHACCSIAACARRLISIKTYRQPPASPHNC